MSSPFNFSQLLSGSTDALDEFMMDAALQQQAAAAEAAAEAVISRNNGGSTADIGLLPRSESASSNLFNFGSQDLGFYGGDEWMNLLGMTTPTTPAVPSSAAAAGTGDVSSPVITGPFVPPTPTPTSQFAQYSLSVQADKAVSNSPATGLAAAQAAPAPAKQTKRCTTQPSLPAEIVAPPAPIQPMQQQQSSQSQSAPGKIMPIPCSHCRRSHHKCDRLPEGCTSCRIRKITCVYDEAEIRAKKQDIDSQSSAKQRKKQSGEAAKKRRKKTAAAAADDEDEDMQDADADDATYVVSSKKRGNGAAVAAVAPAAPAVAAASTPAVQGISKSKKMQQQQHVVNIKSYAPTTAAGQAAAQMLQYYSATDQSAAAGQSQALQLHQRQPQQQQLAYEELSPSGNTHHLNVRSQLADLLCRVYFDWCPFESWLIESERMGAIMRWQLETLRDPSSVFHSRVSVRNHVLSLPPQLLFQPMQVQIPGLNHDQRGLLLGEYALLVALQSHLFQRVGMKELSFQTYQYAVELLTKLWFSFDFDDEEWLHNPSCVDTLKLCASGFAIACFTAIGHGQYTQTEVIRKNLEYFKSKLKPLLKRAEQHQALMQQANAAAVMAGVLASTSSRPPSPAVSTASSSSSSSSSSSGSDQGSPPRLRSLSASSSHQNLEVLNNAILMPIRSDITMLCSSATESTMNYFSRLLFLDRLLMCAPVPQLQPIMDAFLADYYSQRPAQRQQSDLKCPLGRSYALDMLTCLVIGISIIQQFPASYYPEQKLVDSFQVLTEAFSTVTRDRIAACATEQDIHAIVENQEINRQSIADVSEWIVLRGTVLQAFKIFLYNIDRLQQSSGGVALAQQSALDRVRRDTGAIMRKLADQITACTRSPSILLSSSIIVHPIVTVTKMHSDALRQLLESNLQLHMLDPSLRSRLAAEHVNIQALLKQDLRALSRLKERFSLVDRYSEFIKEAQQLLTLDANRGQVVAI